jgi:hypothetical protein
VKRHNVTFALAAFGTTMTQRSLVTRGPRCADGKGVFESAGHRPLTRSDRTHLQKEICLMNRHSYTAGVFLAIIATASTSAAQVTLPPPIVVNSPVVTIDGSAGDQTDPHVDKNLASYTDSPSNQIRYYSFLTQTNAAIPTGSALFDVLSGVNGGRIVFTRVETDRNAIFVFDVATATLSEIDPRAGSNRINPAIGGNTVAYIDRATGNGDVFAFDLANPSLPPALVSASPDAEQNPNVSPDGNTIVWEDCPVSISNCIVFKGIRVAGAWNVSAVPRTALASGNPDTDGQWIVYDQLDPNGESHIHYTPVAGGPDVELLLAGHQQNPSISHGVIGFEHRSSAISPDDLFAYDIASNTLYQVTSTPLADENLNNITVLDNGDIRMVWASNTGAAGDEDIQATTFTPIAQQIPYHVCALYDSAVARKSGAAYPIKLQLCDAVGQNLSSASIVVHAISVTQVSSNTPAALDDTGNANPDSDFRYDPTVSGYIFNLSTKGYATGTYSLNFTAGADPTVHSALFAVK